MAQRVSGENFRGSDFTLIVTGVLTSPNFPENYPKSLQKTEVLEVEEGHILSLQFTAFDIDFSSSGYCNDFLTITDSLGTTLMEKLCGSVELSAITSTSNSIELYFSSDLSVELSGWSMSWNALPAGECDFQLNWLVSPWKIYETDDDYGGFSPAQSSELNL